MLTKITIHNFKTLAEAEIELGSMVVFIGPNDAGKTSALQALTLWEIGVRRFRERRGGSTAPEKRPGVAINRKDLTGIPAPTARLLWHDLHVRNTFRNPQRTENVLIEVIVEGVTEGVRWVCGMEFDYANEESIYCRPSRIDGSDERMAIPEQVDEVRTAFLAPMSGLAANETLLAPGAIDVRIGEGRTAEVLRNLCFQVLLTDSQRWDDIKKRIEHLFGISLSDPSENRERGEVEMTFRTRRGISLDLSAAGRGLQQTLLLLAFLALHPGSVVLLDEPDAHLEILRQRQTYEILAGAAEASGGQVIAASHSEVMLNEAADRDIVVAFVGAPHRIDDRGTQVLKSLKDIGFEEYYQAEQTGWVLYLEGSTDLSVLRSFAATVSHPLGGYLERPFVKYVGNQPNQARSHFHALKEAKPDLLGFALFDNLNAPLNQGSDLAEAMWTRNEIENYLCQPDTLRAWAADAGAASTLGGMFEEEGKLRWVEAMEAAIERNTPPAALTDPDASFWRTMKASDEYLDVVMADFYASLGLGLLMRKSDYHRLAPFVAEAALDPEVGNVLDAIHDLAARATPRA